MEMVARHCQAATSGGRRAVVGVLLENIYAKKIYVDDAILRQEPNYNYYANQGSLLRVDRRRSVTVTYNT
jgi:hypothetical protein